jgi:AcrR family transcriptional regulator
MGAKVGLTHADVVSTATTIADDEGFDEVTLGAVARALGVRTPSLYHHVDGLSGLRRDLALAAADEMSAFMSEAAAAGGDPRDALRAIAYAYRSFAADHPGLYAALLPAPRPGEDDELYRALAGPVNAVVPVLASLGVEEDKMISTVRIVRSLLHGFVTLEHDGGFGMPVDIDDTFDLLVASIERVVT